MQAVKINKDDSVAVALEDLKASQSINIDSKDITLQDDIKRGHKFALHDINAGENIIKYGFAIGSATTCIKAGEHVHSHNVKTNLGAINGYSYCPQSLKELPKKQRSFQGYVRDNGDVGIRNEIWIIPTVFCVNQIARELELYIKDKIADIDNIDEACALTHPYGCSQMGEDQQSTLRLLASLASHPNAAAVIILGLGCENNNIEVFKQYLNLDDTRLFFLNTQDVDDELEEAYAIADRAIELAQKCSRSSVPVSKLRIGLKCGGSDGLSGISANPLIGYLSDVVIGSGGTSVMTEVPEMFGAEQLLMNRCESKEVFDNCVNLINNFKHYFTSHGQTISENPSPGNKAGGITTLEDKSLGCVQKGGSAAVCDVLEYTQRVHRHGLNLLNAPGNDGVSCTALAAASCHLILFSTGRGTPFATVVPTVKIATNTALFNKKNNWIDFNAGEIVQGKSFEELTDELLDFVIDVASGLKTKSEKRGIHEIIIWKDGVTM